MTMNSNENVEAIVALLPWYVSGTLDAESVLRVEAALAERPELRASLRLIEQDREETIALNQALGAPGGHAWARVLDIAQAEPRKPTLAARLAGFAAAIGLGVVPDRRRVAWIGATAAIVIALQGAAILSLLPGRQRGTYKVATVSSTRAGGAKVPIFFRSGVPIDKIDAFLLEHHALIVDGPHRGYFTVQIDATHSTKDELNALVQAPIVEKFLPATSP